MDVSLGQIADAVDDLSAPEIVTTNDWRVEAQEPTETKFIKIDFDRGRVRWANSDRHFDWDTFPHTAVSPSLAEERALLVADLLGIPSPERLPAEVATLNGRMYSTDGLEDIVETERLVTIRRAIGEVPVHGSLMRLAINNQGDPSRLLVRWPQFSLPSGLTLKSRPAAVTDLTDEIFALRDGVPVDEMHITVGYARYGFDYLPAAVLSFDDTKSGQVIVQPLVEVPADLDDDGVPDEADNCPE